MKKREKKKKNKKRWEERSWRERQRDVGILEFRAGSETNLAQIGLSTLAVNSKLCVAFLSHSEANPPPTTRYQLSPSYLSLLPIALFFFLLWCHRAIVFMRKARLGTGSWSVSRLEFSCSAKNVSSKAPDRGQDHAHRGVGRVWPF